MINTDENNYQNITIFHFCYLHISWSFITQFNQILTPEKTSFEAKGLCINCIQDRGSKNTLYQFLPNNFSKSRKCPSKLSDLQFKPFRDIAVKFHTQYQSQIIELEPRPSLKKIIFLVKFMISYDNQSYDKFSHRNSRVIELWSHEYSCNRIRVT